MGKQKKVFIIHFQPLKLFPPAMNLIDFLSKEEDIKLFICTNDKSKSSLTSYENSKVTIFRPSSLTENSYWQYVNYFLFYSSSLFHLLWHRPETVIYIETLSSWPALVYKKIRRSKVRLMAHYHEYTEPGLYASGMVLSKWMHKWELQMYSRFSWISHTNTERMQMFKNDCDLNKMNEELFHIMPNYPSKEWINLKENNYADNKIKRLVFVGSLGYKNMYLKELLDWLAIYRDEFALDVYSYNIDAKAKLTLQECNLPNVQYHGGCNYYDLPAILKNYDIGLVIYKPFSKNTVHAVANKVFEYLACGLDVWFSSDMTYTYNYVRENVYPKVIPVNFEQLQQFDYKSAISREGIRFEPSPYYYEKVYVALRDFILN